MEFTHGNKAIRDHAAEGEDLYLFEVVRPTFVKFLGPAYCSGYEQREEPDAMRISRNVIIFELAMLDDDAIEADAASEAELTGADLEELRRRARETPDPSGNATESKRRAYRRSKALKLYVRARAAGSCEGCGSAAPFMDRRQQPYLEPHHTRRISDGGPDDPVWVIALCPACHARVHYGFDGDEYNESLKSRLADLESE
jgi:5-methylcytosine-specific restriction protein A